MAYSEKKFRKEYKAAVAIRMGDAAEGSRDIGNDTPAWNLYEKTRTAPLGMQVFGRHKQRSTDLPGEPGIELYGEVFPKIAKKRLFGLWNGRESKKERDRRVANAGFAPQLVHPTHGTRAVSPMEFNFGVTSDRSSGSILMMGQEWNLTINDSWLLGGVHAHQPFYLAFRKSYANIFTDSYKHNLTITGRELLGLLLGGYKLVSDDQLGDVMVCEKPSKADQMTLVKYATAAQSFEGPLKGMDVKMNYYTKDKSIMPDDMVKEVEDAIEETEELRKQFVETARAARFNLVA